MFDGNTLDRLEAIVFDLDDTLFDSGAWTCAALRHAAVCRGLQPSSVEQAITSFLERHEASDPGIYNAILLGCGQSDSGHNIRALHEASLSYTGCDREWDLLVGVREALVELSWKYKLALLVDGPVAVQQAKVAALGLEPLFDMVLYSDIIDGPQSRRPDSRSFKRLAEDMHLSGTQMLFVADNPQKDFRPARLHGYGSCRVLTGPFRSLSTASSSQEADFDVTSVARLPERLNLLEQTRCRDLKPQALPEVEDVSFIQPLPVPAPPRTLDAPLVAAQPSLLAAMAHSNWPEHSPLEISTAAAESTDLAAQVPAELRRSFVLLPEPDMKTAPAAGSLPQQRLAQAGQSEHRSRLRSGWLLQADDI